MAAQSSLGDRSPFILIIPEEGTSRLWLCRWSSAGLPMHTERVLCYQKTVEVHDMDRDGISPEAPTTTLAEIATFSPHAIESFLFHLWPLSDTEYGSCSNLHSHGMLGEQIPPSTWYEHQKTAPSTNYVLALSDPPIPLISLSVRVICDDDTPICFGPLHVASWKRQLVGTPIYFRAESKMTTTVDLSNPGQSKVQLRVTSIDHIATDHQNLFLVLPSTRITVQQSEMFPTKSFSRTINTIEMPGLSSGTPKITRILLETILCTHHRVSAPRSFLLSGPAGVGKTFSVRQAIELCPLPVELISLRGSEILQKHSNSSQSLELEFQVAARIEGKVVIIFLDECDALVSIDSAAATLSILLDKVATEWKNILVVGATNLVDSIPIYLRRAGRFDREIVLHPPNPQERAAILKELLKFEHHDHAENQAFHSQVDHISDLCVGYVPADLNSLVQKASLLARRQGKISTTLDFLEAAMTEVGPSALRDALLVAPPKITWDAIAGDPGGAKTALRQAIEWPRTKKAAFARLGLKPPRGILLHGPPGCAKTTLARAAAGASGVAFLSLSPAEVYSSSYVGEAEAVVRSAFSLARSASPCVLFFDEIDSIFGGSQDGGRGGSAEARVLSTFLNEMDGVDSNGGADGVVVLGATNRPWTLDAALVRPGRLGDKVIYIPPPDQAARQAILGMQFSSQKSDMNFEFLSSDEVSGSTTGAELVGACQEAKFRAMRDAINSPLSKMSMEGLRLQELLVGVLQTRTPMLASLESLREYRIFDRNMTPRSATGV